MISNTRAAVSAYAEAVADGIQARLRLRLFELIWAQGRNMSSAYDVRRVVAALQWPADPISLHLASPDLPAPVLHDPDPMRIVRREGGTITPDGGPLTTAAYDQARQWRQQWLALFEPALAEPALPAVIGPDGAVHVGPDGRTALPGRDRGSGRPQLALRRAGHHPAPPGQLGHGRRAEPGATELPGLTV